MKRSLKAEALSYSSALHNAAKIEGARRCTEWKNGIEEQEKRGRKEWA
jgi:hypothetical protein